MTATRIFALAALLLLAAMPATAQQKIAYVDIAAIMKDLPEAQEAQRMLDAQVDTWQQELQELEDEWQAKFNDYDKRKLILTDQGRAKAEKDLQELDARIMQYRDTKFGQDGELFKLEDQLMRPIQDLVFDQVKQLAVELGFDYVFDKSGGVMIIYAKEDYDLTKKAIDRIKTVLPPRQLSGGQQGQPGQSQPGQTQPGQRAPGTPPPGTQPPRMPSDQPIEYPGK
ncbi:MAG: OmpH family outer membrane protein [Bacteroidota bacterium]|jgi:outer membrane protein|nr:OmpH family outer membrane protein [Bacteroidota bacterium]